MQRPKKRTSFILYMLLRVAKRFLQYLKQIDKIYSYMERQLINPSGTKSSSSFWTWRSRWYTSIPP